MPQICSFARLAVLFAATLIAACGGSDEPEVPFATATDVKAAYDAAPQIMSDYFSGRGTKNPLVYMRYLKQGEPGNFREPWHFVIQYGDKVIYDNAVTFPYADHGVAFKGVDLIVVREHSSSPNLPATKSVVFVNGERIQVLESISVNMGASGILPAVVYDVREYRGWLIIYAGKGVYNAPWRVERWVMYHLESKTFVDCGEYGSNRHPDWGPSAPSVCERR